MLDQPRTSTHYVITGAKTYRLSSRKILKQWGGNLQNIEKSNRKRFQPDHGKLFVQVDQSGAEALIVSHCMPKTNKLRQLFDNGIKIHNYLGVVFTEHWRARFPMVEDFIKIPIAEIRNHPKWSEFVKAVADSDENPPATRYYYHYKQSGHSFNYGCQPNAFIGNILLKSKGKVQLSLSQGMRYYEGYHALLPEIQNNYHRWVARTYEKDGILRNLQGFPIHITSRVFEHNYKEIYDKIPQSTVGTITNIAFTQTQRLIEEERLEGWDIIQNNHDSYLGQFPEGEVETAAKVMCDLMEQEMVSPFGEKFRMKASIQIGGNWCPFHPKKNPNGLVEVKL